MLTPTEQNHLKFYEAKIEKGLKTFIEVGESLLKIKNEKLYRQSHSTFEEYCEKRWNIGIRQSQRLMNAAEVVKNLKEHDQSVVLPTSEYQIRTLAQLPSVAQKAIWEKVSSTQQPITGRIIENAVKDYTGTPENQKLHFSSNSEEWYSPQKIISPTLKLLGSIDIDPCSNSTESPNVPAKRHFTINENGLHQEWRGKVYMNPPYGSVIQEWIEKLIHQFEKGNTTEAITLIPARTDTVWFGLLKNHPRCFIKGRLHFSESETPAPFPSAVVYMGQNISQFVKHFKDIGDIYTLIEAQQSIA